MFYPLCSDSRPVLQQPAGEDSGASDYCCDLVAGGRHHTSDSGCGLQQQETSQSIQLPQDDLQQC